MKILDRYLIREVAGPFFLTLGMFTFLLSIKPMLPEAEKLLAKGVSISTAAFLLSTLIPQALGLTIPMAFMSGLVMGLGRLSGDREAVALLACGVSPLRLLRPVVLFALIAGGIDMYVLMELVPDANQTWRVVTTKLLEQQGENDIKPGQFYEGFTGNTIWVQERRPGGGWSGVFLADMSDPARPIVSLGNTGALEIDLSKHQVAMVLPGESVRYIPGEPRGIYDVSRAKDFRIKVDAEAVFGSGAILARGNREMKIPQLRELEEQKRLTGMSPHNEIMQRHQMFAFPVACLAFAVLGLALGLHTRKDGKLGGLTLGIVAIFVYDGIMVLCEAYAKAHTIPAEWARWIPDIVLGIAGVAALWWRNRSSEPDLNFARPDWLIAILRRWQPAREPATPRPPVVVIRIPAYAAPRPRLLDLYVARKYVTFMTLTVVSLLGLYYVVTFVDKSEKLFKNVADGWLLAQYFYYSTPQYVAWIVPMAALVAVLATLGGLMRTGELVVMRACGISLYRAAAPLMLLALLLSGGLFLLDDRVLAFANHRAQQLDDRIRSGEAPTLTPTVAGATWLLDENGRVFHYMSFDTTRQTLYGLSVFQTAQRPFRLTSHTYAATATFTKGTWRADGVWTETFPDTDKVKRATADHQVLSLPAPAKFAKAETQEAAMMTFGELRNHIAKQQAGGFNLAESEVTLQGRIAFPLVALVMTVLGVPFAVATGRRGTLYGVGLAIVLSFTYWLLNTFFVAVGQADLLPPLLAAWGANLLFLAMAGYLTLTVRT